MFNTSGTELLVILLVALIVLGPEKLPEAARKVGNVMREIRRMSSGFQAEVRDALAEPVAMVNDTVSTVKSGWTAEPGTAASGTATAASGTATAASGTATAASGTATAAPAGAGATLATDGADRVPAPPPPLLPPPDGPRADLPPPRA